MSGVEVLFRGSYCCHRIRIAYLFAAFLIAIGVKTLWWGGEETNIAKNAALKLVRRRFRVTDRLHGEQFFARLPDIRTGQPAASVSPSSSPTLAGA